MILEVRMNKSYDDPIFRKNLSQKLLSQMLILTNATTWLTAALNIYNKRPVSNVLIPFVAGLLCLFLYDLQKKPGYEAIVKYISLVLFCIIFIPIAWLTSPGSTSAMPYYSLLVITLGVVLTEKPWDLAFPITSLIEVLVMFQLEAIYPSWFAVYEVFRIRLFDLTINFFVASMVLIMMLYTMISNYQKQHKDMYQLSMTDPLTKIRNRRYLIGQLEALHTNPHHKPYVFLLVDVVHFKEVNKTFGHHKGDQLLIDLAAMLQKNMRPIDIVSRYGGDAFIMMLPDTSAQEAEWFKSRIQDAFLLYCKQFLPIEVGINVRILPSENHDLETLMVKIDECLYTD